jgi:hypothetical protein
MAWASGTTTLRKDARHSGSSIDTVGGSKLLESWALTPADPNSNGECGPVIYKNVAFYSSRNMLDAMDVMPGEDLDQDGDPDDGLPDVGGMGLDYGGQDVIWKWECPDGGLISSPTVVSVQDPRDPRASVEAVLVLSTGGNVYMLDAFPHSTGGSALLGATKSVMGANKDFYNLPTKVDKPYPPQYVNGWIYAVGGDGRLYAYNPSLEAWGAQHNGAGDVYYQWNVPTNFGQSGDTAEGRSGPSFGFVKNDGSGAVVGMVYWYASTWKTPALACQWSRGIGSSIASTAPVPRDCPVRGPRAPVWGWRSRAGSRGPTAGICDWPAATTRAACFASRFRRGTP